MNLEEYKHKRKFWVTPEPSGEQIEEMKDRMLFFVVQKHKSRQLHYDFRIELDGVLKSWAVPKGPSPDPQETRLAMMVEDHPLEYGDFEGIIPEGNYGAGTVMIWDRGNYLATGETDKQSSQEVLRDFFAKGHISIVLNGERLKGRYDLIKLKKSTDEKEWLLIKAKDDWANIDYPNGKSVASGRTMAQIADIAEKENNVWLPYKPELVKLPTTPIPKTIAPMLASVTDKPFNDKEWIFEIKWDGYRTVAFAEAGNVNLVSRNGKSFNHMFPEIAESLGQTKAEAILDGEIVALDESGQPSFNLIQNRLRRGSEVMVRYYVFDILYLNGKDLRNLALYKRKEILKQILVENNLVKYCDHIEEKGLEFWEISKKHGLEGIVAKDKFSPYIENTRTKRWLKIRNKKRISAAIIGYTKPQGGRTHFGALLLGVFEKGEYSYIGRVGTGFSDEALSQLGSVLEQLRKYKTKVIGWKKSDIPADTVWVEPKLVGEVEFSEWTKEGFLRHPVFLGLREDINPEDTYREI